MVLRPALAALAVLALGGQLDALLPQGPPRPVALASPLPALPDSGGPAADLAWTPGEPASCEGHCVVALPQGAAGELWVLWDGARTRGFLAGAERGGRIEPAQPAFDAARVAVLGGERVHLWGDGAFELAVLAPVRGLPNLAAVAPAHLGKAAEGAGASGCLPEEAEAGLRTCLRFSTGLANTGDAPLELSLRGDGEGLRMVQALPGDDREAGVADYHASHGHFHYARFMAFALHEVDPATGLRGEEALASSKTGFCMVDWGPTSDAEALPGKTFWRDGCGPASPRLRMGVNPGWYDVYRWFLPEQALDAAGLPDGTYELVATVDPDWTIAEEHRFDNRASAVFDWHGGNATLRSSHGLYRLSPDCPPWC